jgi:lipoprotein-anchoring transpeptidase ErfK/SrfK
MPSLARKLPQAGAYAFASMADPVDPTVSPEARRGAQTRSHRATAAAAAILVVAVIAATVWALNREDGTTKALAQGPTTTTSTTTTTAPPAFEPFVSAQSAVPEITAYDAPADGAGTIGTFSQFTRYLAPRTFLVIDEQSDWLQVLLPMRPNGTTGWIRGSEVTLGQTEYEIRVELSTTKVTLLKAGEVVLETTSGVGRDETPTPVGRYYITDPVDLQPEPNGAYGAYALGISGYSEVLFEFNGGDGQVAIHGTTNPGDLGQKVSNGCVRVINDVIVQIAAQVSIGTPITVVA